MSWIDGCETCSHTL